MAVLRIKRPAYDAAPPAPGWSIQMAPDLALTEEAVTQTFGFIARKGHGKTYGAGVLVEGLHAIGAGYCVIDQVGNWWGLRLSADGKGKGLPIIVFGGRHGDIPIAPEMGRALGRLVMEKQLRCVIDVSEMRKGERKRFLADFCEDLFHTAKGLLVPYMVVFEEAQLIAPQHVQGDEARMLGAVEDIVRLGRNYGLGSTLITQRPQSVSKAVLNQVECLFVGQLSGSHERKAIDDWIVEQEGEADEARQYLSTLPSLPRGTMWVWSPQWLKAFKRVAIGRKRTFDASSTPRLGDAKRENKAPQATPDDDTLKAIRDALGEAVKDAADQDPKALRQEVKRLNANLDDAQETIQQLAHDLDVALDVARAQPRGPNTETLKAALNQVFEQFVVDIERALETVGQRWTEAVGVAEQVSAPDSSPRLPRPNTPLQDTIDAVNRRPAGVVAPRTTSLPRGAATRILQALSLGPLTRRQIGMLAVLSYTAGSFRNVMGQLRQDGLIEDTGDTVSITKSGRARLGDARWTSYPTVEERHDRWRQTDGMGGATGKMLAVLVQAGINGWMTREQLGARTGHDPNAGSFRNNLGTLRSRGLLDEEGRGKQRKLRLTPDFFYRVHG